MGVLDRLAFWRRSDLTSHELTPDQVASVLPGSIAIDTSLPVFTAQLTQLRSSIGVISPTIAPEFIDVLFALSVANPLLSEVVFDGVTLANSGHTISIEAGSDAAIDAALDEINGLTARMHVGGLNGWFNVALYQLMVTGALSHEWVVLDDLDGLKRSKFVPVQSIRFVASPEHDGTFVPIQQRRNFDGVDVILNPVTYHYRSLLQFENVPYAIPPFLGAIEALFIQRDMLSQIGVLAAKVGLIGVLQFLMKPPQQDLANGETDEDYGIRLKKVLTEAKDELKKNMQGGVFVGFEGSHTIDHSPISSGADGVDKLWDRVDIMAHSGANTDPSLHGRNFSRTETHIKQIFQKKVRQLKSMRRVLTQSVHEGFALHLQLADIDATATVLWEPIDTFDAEADEEVRKLQIENVSKLYNEGVISQEQKAQMLGFDAPDIDAPRLRAVFKFQGGRYVQESRVGAVRTMMTADGPATIRMSESDRPAPPVVETVPNWPDLSDFECGCGDGRFESQLQQGAADALDDIIDDYAAAVLRKARRSNDRSIRAVRAFLKVSARRIEPDQFAAELFGVLEREFSGAMTDSEMRQIVEDGTFAVYNEARLGSGFTAAIETVDLPEDVVQPVFNVLEDTRTLGFLQDTDITWLGRYVRRGDTADRVTARIRDEYIRVGRDWTDRTFVPKIAEQLELETWQAQRIVRATTNMSRNMASLRTFEQIGIVTTFEIVGPIDRLKCPWCLSMIGRTFSVKKAITRMNSTIAAGPEALPRTRPILTSEVPLTERADGTKFIDLTDDQLQAAGFDLPHYHPNCRDVVVARDIDG